MPGPRPLVPSTAGSTAGLVSGYASAHSRASYGVTPGPDAQGEVGPSQPHSHGMAGAQLRVCHGRGHREPASPFSASRLQRLHLGGGWHSPTLLVAAGGTQKLGLPSQDFSRLCQPCPTPALWHSDQAKCQGGGLLKPRMLQGHNDLSSWPPAVDKQREQDTGARDEVNQPIKN